MPPSVSLLAVLIWFIARGIYWRSGGGRKIGLAFDGFRIPPDDWVEVRKELAGLFENPPLQTRVSLRIFPSTMIATEVRWKRTLQRYRLSNIFRMSAATLLGDDKKTKIDMHWTVNIGKVVSGEFLETVGRLAASISTNQRQIATHRDVLKFQAETAFDVLLYSLAVIEYANQQFEAADVFFRKLNQQLSRRTEFPHQVLLNIRWLHALCLIAASEFPGNSPPAAEELLKARELCEYAVAAYGHDFPFLRNVLARDLFYLRDIDAALEQANAALAVGLVEFELDSALLNHAVLLLFKDKYEESAESWRRLFVSPNLRRFNWQDLIRFADHAYQYGYPQAVFLRSLYRKLVKTDQPQSLVRQLAAWFEADPNRRHLQYVFYLTSMPNLSGAVTVKQVKSTTTRKSGAQSKSKRQNRRRR